jgi:major membrane immunogen (membrane-anchored lipoprotein)
MSIFVEALLVWFVVLALLIGFVAGSSHERSAGDETNKRYRMAVGYVGENGIEADVEYCVRDGKLAKAGDPDDEDE